MRKALSISFSLVLLGSACGDDGGSTGTIDARGIDAPSNTIDAQSADARRPSGNACDRVDMIFAIDGSSSMKEEIQSLSEDVFPVLVEELRKIGGGTEDYRVGVLDGCKAKADFHTIKENATPEGESCNFSSGEAWMESSSPDLASEFSCVANIYKGDYDETDAGLDAGTGTVCTAQQDDEQPAAAAGVAMSQEFAGPGGPNEGFLRDNALLLVVAITDEDETPIDIDPQGDAEYVQAVYDSLVAIKGDVSRMVFLGIGGTMGCRDADGYGAARQSRRMILLTDMFIAQDRGVFWDLCEGGLEQGLTEAMTVIESTCNQVE